MKGYGMDFGTTNSLIAFFDSDLDKNLGAFTDAGRPHPSLVWYKPDSTRPVVGWEARQNMHRANTRMGHRFVHSVKRLMMKRGEVPILGTQRKSPSEVGADIISHLLRHAKDSRLAAARELSSCVATVPVNSTGRYRRELRRAAELAGLKVDSFTHEPFAAVFGYYFSKGLNLGKLPSSKVLVFDWGGGTLDITLVQVEDGHIFELGNSNLSDCAGDEFTEKLSAIARNKFLRRSALDPEILQFDAEAKDRIWINMEEAKIRLSREASVPVNVPDYTRHADSLSDLSEEISLLEYEAQIRQEVDLARSKVRACLDRAAVEAELVDLVLLVGGTSRTPAVYQMMREMFVTRVVAVEDADAIIAKGAAVIAAHQWKPYLQKPITIKLADKSYLPLFKYGEILAAPLASKSFTFYCVDGRNGEAHLLFYEQQRHGDASDQKSLNCNFSFPTPRDVRHVSELDRFMINCSVTEDLTIRVEAKRSSEEATESVEIVDICYGLKVA